MAQGMHPMAVQNLLHITELYLTRFSSKRKVVDLKPASEDCPKPFKRAFISRCPAAEGSHSNPISDNQGKGGHGVQGSQGPENQQPAPGLRRSGTSSSNCPHGRRKDRCKQCGGGSSFCVHSRRRWECRDCGGSSICPHNRRRARCRECGGASICEHGRERWTCRACGGRCVCEHGRQRSKCSQCANLSAGAAERDVTGGLTKSTLVGGGPAVRPPLAPQSQPRSYMSLLAPSLPPLPPLLPQPFLEGLRAASDAQNQAPPQPSGVLNTPTDRSGLQADAGFRLQPVSLSSPPPPLLAPPGSFSPAAVMPTVSCLPLPPIFSMYASCGNSFLLHDPPSLPLPTAGGGREAPSSLFLAPLRPRPTRPGSSAAPIGSLRSAFSRCSARGGFSLSSAAYTT
jgi:hypothetical protein